MALALIGFTPPAGFLTRVTSQKQPKQLDNPFVANGVRVYCTHFRNRSSAYAKKDRATSTWLRVDQRFGVTFGEFSANIYGFEKPELSNKSRGGSLSGPLSARQGLHMRQDVQVPMIDATDARTGLTPESRVMPLQ